MFTSKGDSGNTYILYISIVKQTNKPEKLYISDINKIVCIGKKFVFLMCVFSIFL